MSSCSIRVFGSSAVVVVKIFGDSTWHCVGNAASVPPGRASGWWYPDEGMSHYPRLVLCDEKELPMFIFRNCTFPAYGDARGNAVCCWQPNAWKYSQKDPGAYVQGNAEWKAEPTDADMVALAEEIERSRQEMRELAFEIGLDVAGIADPTPICDITSASLQLRKGEFIGAGLTLLGVVPYLGDVGKLVKAPSLAARLSKVEKRLEAAVRALNVTKEKLDAVRRGARKLAERYYFKVIDGAVAAKSLFKDLPLFRNPRLLKKHAGPIAPESLIDELAGKGFVQIKMGRHAAPPIMEDSDIWIRRVMDSGKEQFECIRLDLRPTNPALDRRVGKDGVVRESSADVLQSKDKANRRIHNWVDDGAANQGQKVGQLQGGQAFKGDFSHYHHEKFDATESNLAMYLSPPQKDAATGAFLQPSGLKKFDSTGQEVPPSSWPKAWGQKAKFGE